MSANFGSSSSGKGGSQDFELNLASIIDCFTVLITFLLASASFLSLGILDAGVAAAGTDAQENAKPSITLQVELKSDHSIAVHSEGTFNFQREVRAKNGLYNREELKQILSEAKAGRGDLDSVILSAGGDVAYEDVIVHMNEIRSVIPTVALGGF